MLEKRGRQRHYDISPLNGYADSEIAFMAAYLSELRARVIDQFEDLPTEALDFVHPKVRFTIGQLAIHLSWGEAQRLSTFFSAPVDPEVEAVLSQGALSALGHELPPSRSAMELIGIVDELEHGLQFMITILPAAGDMQHEVKFCRCRQQQSSIGRSGMFVSHPRTVVTHQ